MKSIAVRSYLFIRRTSWWIARTSGSGVSAVFSGSGMPARLSIGRREDWKAGRSGGPSPGGFMVGVGSGSGSIRGTFGRQGMVDDKWAIVDEKTDGGR